MKLVVVAGFRSPYDPEGKSRPAVVLGMVDGRLAIAPCSTYPARHDKVVPPDCVIVQKSSPCFKDSKFDSDNTAIKVGDTALFNVGSKWVRNLRQIGVIDLELDKRLGDNLRAVMREQNVCRT